MLRRALPLPLRMRPRVQRAPGIPCALRFLEGQRMSQLGRQVSREGGVVCATDAIVIPGRRYAPSPESITTKLRLGHDAARVMFKSGSGGYGFRARCFASPRNDKWRDCGPRYARPGMTDGGISARPGMTTEGIACAQPGAGLRCSIARQATLSRNASSAAWTASGVPTCIQTPSSRNPNRRSCSLARSNIRVSENSPAGASVNSDGDRMAAPA